MKQTDGDLNRVKRHHKDVLWNSQTEQITQETGEKKVMENWQQTTTIFMLFTKWPSTCVERCLIISHNLILKKNPNIFYPENVGGDRQGIVVLIEHRSQSHASVSVHLTAVSGAACVSHDICLLSILSSPWEKKYNFLCLPLSQTNAIWDAVPESLEGLRQKLKLWPSEY